MHSNPSGRKWLGALMIPIGGAGIYASALEVYYYWGNQIGNVVVGSLGVVACLAFLCAGITLLINGRYARVLSIASAGAMAAVHVVGVALRYVGIPGVLLGIIFPAVVMWMNWRSPKGPISKSGPVSHSAG